jgi:hypothetical protein
MLRDFPVPVGDSNIPMRLFSSVCTMDDMRSFCTCTKDSSQGQSGDISWVEGLERIVVDTELKLAYTYRVGRKWKPEGVGQRWGCHEGSVRNTAR